MYNNQVQVTDASFADYIIDPDNLITNYKDSDLPTYLGLHDASSTLKESDGKEKVLKVINWRNLQINTFPNNKYHRFSVNEPIKFYNYDACLNPTVHPADYYKDDIRTRVNYGWADGKTGSSNGIGIGQTAINAVVKWTRCRYTTRSYLIPKFTR